MIYSNIDSFICGEGTSQNSIFLELEIRVAQAVWTSRASMAQNWHKL